MDIKTKELGLEGENIKAMYKIINQDGVPQTGKGSHTDRKGIVHPGVVYSILMPGRVLATRNLGIQIKDLDQGARVLVNAAQGTYILTIERHTRSSTVGSVEKYLDETNGFKDAGRGITFPGRIIVGEQFTLNIQNQVWDFPEKITPTSFKVLDSTTKIP